MKKSLIALAALAVVSAASAQSSVTISGSVAAAYERLPTAGAKGNITGFDASSNNITFKGDEDLGNGLKAGFVLNKRFNVASGNTGGTSNNSAREFENSYLTLQSATLGLIGFGRNQAVSFSSFDPFGNLGTDMASDAAGTNTSNGTNYANNNFVGNRDNATVFYTSPTFSGFKVTYQTTVNPAVNDKEYSVVKVDYTNGPLTVSAAQEWNEVVIASAGTAAVKDKQFAASYDFGIVKTALVWGKAGDTKSRTAIHATVPVNAATKLIATYRTKGTGTETAFALGAEYSLSKRTTAFAHMGDTGAVQTAYRIGVRHSF